MQLILDEQTINTTGTQDSFPWTPYNYNSGKGMVYAFGVFGGATITVEFSPDAGVTWFAIGTDTTFTAAGWSNFEMQGIVLIRGTVTDAGGTTSVSLGIL